MRFKTHYENASKDKGFTLVEVVVVLAIFIIVIDVAVTIFISMISHQKRILEEQEFINQASYAMEYMSKSLRVAAKDNDGICLQGYPGYIYLLPAARYNAQDGFYEGVKFLTEDGACKEFFLDSSGLLKEARNQDTPQNILSGKFTVKEARFIANGDKTLNGASGIGSIQPRLTILLKIETNIGQTLQEKIIQTTI